MALGIPMPGAPGESFMKGLDTGSSMFTRMMDPILRREQMAQQKAMQEAQLAQQMQLHNDSMALRRAAEGRLSAMMPFQQKIAQMKLEQMEREGNPQKQLQYIQSLLGGMRGDENQQEAPPMPMYQGFGLPSEETMQNEIQPPSKKNLMQMLASVTPEERMALEMAGIKLPSIRQTPEEKNMAALDLFRQKEEIKRNAMGGDTPTNTVLTQNQKAIQAIDTVLPMIDEFIDNPSMVYGMGEFNPSRKAAYNAKTGGMIDTLIAAQSLPQVQASLELVEQQIRRATGESTNSYIERLKDFRKDLLERRGKAKSVLTRKKVNTESLPDMRSMSDEELRMIAGGG